METTLFVLNKALNERETWRGHRIRDNHRTPSIELAQKLNCSKSLSLFENEYIFS